jgi:hypothetical protein
MCFVQGFGKPLSGNQIMFWTLAVAEIYTANNILCGYTKRRDLCVAHKLFDEMPPRDRFMGLKHVFLFWAKFDAAVEALSRV